MDTRLDLGGRELDTGLDLGGRDTSHDFRHGGLVRGGGVAVDKGFGVSLSLG